MGKPKTYYYGVHKGRPHVSIINDGFSDVSKGVFLFLKKKDAENIFTKVKSVKIK